MGLPVGLTVLFCWPKKPEEDYVYKKVDAPSEDVEEEEEEEEEAEATLAEDQGEENAQAEVEGEEAEEEEEEEEEEVNGLSGDDDDEEEEEEECDDGVEGDSKAPKRTVDSKGDGEGMDESQKQSVRKRRVRKD